MASGRVVSQKQMNDKGESLNLESRFPMSTPFLFKWRHFLPEIILLNVQWYCRYALSYQDLEEMMQERGINVDHSTINLWVLKYAPELDKRIRPHLQPTNDSWRVDETYIKIKMLLTHQQLTNSKLMSNYRKPPS